MENSCGQIKLYERTAGIVAKLVAIATFPYALARIGSGYSLKPSPILHEPRTPLAVSTGPGVPCVCMLV